MIALSSPHVIVVGAGPAGATAARALAIAGIRVLLLDRAAFPRNKPCGGGISMRALQRFPYLAPRLSAIATHTVARLYLEGPDGESAVVESDGPAALLIRRVEFDALLVTLACEAGATLVAGADVVQAHEERDGIVLRTRDGRTFSAPIVVAADGVHSVVARRLGLNPGWPRASVALDLMEETPRADLCDLDPSTMWVCYGCNPSGRTPVKGRSAPEGYAYIFPKRDHVNVGIGYVLSHYRDAVGVAPYDLQRAFVDRLLRDGIVAGASVRRNFTPAIIPVAGPLRTVARGRVLLAGDAGGFVNGLTAEGIYYAMVTGELTARAIAETRGDLQALARRYRRLCGDEIGTELADSVLLQRFLFADRRRISRIVTGATRESVLRRKILDWLMGRVPYDQARRAVVVRAPLLAARLAWPALRGRIAAAT